MKKTFKLIEKYIPEPCTIKLNQNKEIMSYDILNNKNNNIGYISLTNTGDLKTYSYSGEIIKPIKHPLTERSIIEKTNEFLNTFVENSDLKLASVYTQASNYQVIYEEKDTKYDLYLPDTGVEIVLNLAGNILSFNKKNDKYKVNNSNKIITSEEAKKHFLDRLNLDLKVSKLPVHNHYKLVYGFNDKNSYVPASGEELEVQLHDHHLKKLEPYTTSSKILFKILGLNGDYSKVGKKNKKDFRIELWSKQSKKSLIQLNYDIDEPQAGVIKYKINKHTNQIVQICDGELFTQDSNEVITDKEAYNRVLDFLFTLYPEADEFFDIYESGSVEEINQTYESNDMYYFNRIHDSIEVEDQIAAIGLGKYTGMINKFYAPTVTEKELAHINVFAKISDTEAKNIYASNLKMKLGFIKNIDKQSNVTYELAYLPVLYEGKSNLHFIDAHEGMIYEL